MRFTLTSFYYITGLRFVCSSCSFFLISVTVSTRRGAVRWKVMSGVRVSGPTRVSRLWGPSTGPLNGRPVTTGSGSVISPSTKRTSRTRDPPSATWTRPGPVNDSSTNTYEHDGPGPVSRGPPCPVLGKRWGGNSISILTCHLCLTSGFLDGVGLTVTFSTNDTRTRT